jgi:hypothetical protein
MKRWFLLIAVFALVFSACDTSGGKEVDEAISDNPESVDIPVDTPAPNPDSPIVVDDTEPIDDPSTTDNPIVIGDEDLSWQNDTRVTAIDSASYKWMRKPIKPSSKSYARSVVYNIAIGDPIAEYCTEPGWAYIFYNDQAVIGYEPFPNRVDVMHNAVKITVESRNLQYPNEPWGFINVPMPSPPPPVTSNDPVLGKWQFALCDDLGEIVDGPYTAEFDFNWTFFKESTAAQLLEIYNLEHDPDAHIVWGTDE